MRAALHAHILCWYYLRDQAARDERLKAEGAKEYEPLAAIARSGPVGANPRQRPSTQVVEKREAQKELQVQEDDMCGS